MDDVALPNEILFEVVKCALSPYWPPDLFFPPPPNRLYIRGFRAASRGCRDIVRAVEHEILYVKDLTALANMDLPFPASVRYVQVRIVRRSNSPKAPAVTPAQLPHAAHEDIFTSAHAHRNFPLTAGSKAPCP